MSKRATRSRFGWRQTCGEIRSSERSSMSTLVRLRIDSIIPLIPRMKSIDFGDIRARSRRGDRSECRRFSAWMAWLLPAVMLAPFHWINVES